MRIASILLSLVLLAACVAWNPQIGMSYSEFQDHWNQSDNMDSPRLVADDGETRVYETNGAFYYFVDGRLELIDQGQRLRGDEISPTDQEDALKIEEYEDPSDSIET
jgi:hypothetical protein